MDLRDGDVLKLENSLLSQGTAVGASGLTQRYEIGKKLAEGGMGEVYLGKDLRLRREVAIKKIGNLRGNLKET